MARAKSSSVTWAWAGLVLLALSFVVVSQRLFADRYAAGDVFPAYSSWGSDADGTRALYRALKALDTPSVERSVQPLARRVENFEGEASSTAWLMAGWTGRGGQGTVSALDTLARAGARVVVAVAPPKEQDRTAVEDDNGDETEPGKGVEGDSPSESETSEVDGGDEQAEGGESEDAEGDTVRPLNAFGRWGAALAESEIEGQRLAKMSNQPEDALPGELPWPSSYYFELSSDAWAVLYSTEDGPVLIERRLDAGSLVLATANHFLTNKGQAEARQTALVAHLVGDAERVVFEESHLGIVASPGVVALARRYRLHGVGLALLLVMLLAVWRGASSLMPAMERLAPSGVEARSSREGMVALLRRGIRERELLGVCLEQWSTGERHEEPGDEAIEMARATDLVKGYRRLSRLLQRTRRSG